MDTVSTFRHEPMKSLIGKTAVNQPFLWRSEPVVTRLRRFHYDNKKLGRQIDVPISASPAVIEDVGVVVASDDGFVRFLSSDLSKVFWERRLSASIYASLVVDAVDGRVIVCDTSGLVCALDLSGKLVWSQNLRHPIFATPAVNLAFDTLTIAAFGNMAFGLSLCAGEIRYQVSLPPPWYIKVDSAIAHRNPYASPAATPTGETVYCSGSNVLMFSSSGQEVWRASLDTDIKSSPVVLPAESQVVVTGVSGQCHFLSLQSGETLATLPLGAKVVASGACSNGILALGATTGRVWGIDCGTRRIVWTSEFGAPGEYGSITLTPLGDFVAATATGNCVCLAADDGRFLWETSQVTGLPDQGTRIEITPIIDRTGRMYGAGYDGSLFQFSFQRREEETLS
jgi:outer membrane protein assembly factor BamB